MSKIDIKITQPRLPDDLLALIEKPFKRKMAMAERISKKDYLTGPRPMKLGVVSGRLRNSIKTDVSRLNKKMKGSIGTKVVYGPIHEFGGQMGRGHGRMPARPFLQPALDGIIPSLEKEILKAIQKDWNKR